MLEYLGFVKAEIEGDSSNSLAHKQEMYPARAAALYLRALLNIVSNIFEQRAFHTINDNMLTLLIDGQLHSEAILDTWCVNCPKISVPLQ